MHLIESTRAVWVSSAVALSLACAVPGSALAQFYQYSITATVTEVQAVDAAGNAVAGYDYTKFSNAGIVVGASATSTATIDSATPDTTDPPDATNGSYLGAYSEFAVGSVSRAGFRVNNGVAVMNDRAGGQDSIPLAHDIFAWGGTRSSSGTGPSWIEMNDGTPADRKGYAVILIEWGTTNALSSIALPTTLTLGSFNFMKDLVINFYDKDVGQRVDVKAAIDTLTVDTNAAAPLPVPALDRWAVGLLVALLLALGSLLVGGVRRRTA